MVFPERLAAGPKARHGPQTERRAKSWNRCIACPTWARQLGVNQVMSRRASTWQSIDCNSQPVARGGLDELVLSDKVLRPGPRRAPVRTPLSPPHASSRHAVPAPRRRDRRPAARVPRGGAGLPPGGHRPLREAPQRRVHGQERPERRHGPRRRPGLRRRHEAADQDRRRRQHRRRQIQDVRLRLGARAASARGTGGCAAGRPRGAARAPTRSNGPRF